MMSFFRKVKGSVSLILIFVMFPLLTQATMIVDASRVNSAKTAVSGAGDLAMNAALSQYDRALQDIYGLFAVSGNDINALQDTFKAYFGNTLQGMLSGNDSITLDYIDQLTTGVVDGIFASDSISEDDMVNHLAMNTVDLTISGNSSSTLSNPAVMKTQIVEYMKYKAPLMFTTSILDQMNAIGGSKSQSDAVQAQVNYTESLNTLQSSCDNARTSIETYNGSVIELNTAAGKASDVSAMFNDNGAVKNYLASATTNLLYYRNIYDKYWSGDNPIYPYADVNAAFNAQPDPATYSLAEDSSGKYTGLLNDGSPVTYNVKSNDLFDLLNESKPSSDAEGNTETKLVKDYKRDAYRSGKYESLFSLEKRVKESEETIQSNISAISDVNTKLDSISGSGVDYISSYHSNIVMNYSADTLGSYLHMLDDHNGIIGNYTVTMNLLVSSISMRANEMLPYILKKPGSTETYEDESTITSNVKKLQLQEFKADYEILANFTNIAAIESAATTGGYPKITDNDDGTKTYKFDLTTTKISNNFNSRYTSVANKSYTAYDFSSKLQNAISQCETCRDSYKTNANTAFTNAWNAINAYKTQLNTAKNNISDVVTKLEAVKTTAETVQGNHTTWSKKIEATPEGSTKQTMESQCAAEGEKIDPAEISALIAFANAQKSAYETLIAKLDAITYFGVKVYSGQMNADTFVSGASGGSWRGTYSGSTALANITDPNEVESKTTSLMSEFYQPADGGISAEMIDSVSIADKTKFVQFGYGAGSENANAANHPNEMYFTDKYADCDETLALSFYNKLLNITKEPIGKQSESEESVQSQLKNSVPADSKETKPDEMKARNAVSEEDAAALNAVLTAINEAAKNGSTAGVTDVKGGMNNMDHVSDGDNSSTSEDLNNKLSSTGSYLENITEFANTALNTVINYAYLEEYFTSMFSCYTTNKSEDGKDLPEDKYEITLEGIKLCAENNKYFGAEQEYIVWGGSADSAVAKTMGTIFAIRFVLNTIYAFTSAEIQSTACSIATAIAGWTVFGVPLVQAIVTMVFALAESGLDLAELASGKSVPIYKSATTWKCSISGLTRTTFEYAADKVVEKTADFVSQLADDTITNLSGSATEYINSQIDSAVQSLKDSLFSATTGPILEMYASFGDSVKNRANDVKTKLNESINNITNTIGSDTPVQKAACEGLSLFISSYSDKFIDEVISELNSSIGSGEDFIFQIQKKISEKIDHYVEGDGQNQSGIKGVIKGKIDELSSKLKEAADKTINDFSDQARSQVKEAFSEYAGETAENVKNVDTKDTKTISMNYKQYLKIFMLVALLADQNGMLNRCAALIECNMNYMPGAVCPYKKEGYSLKIPSAYTLVDADATVEIRTIFSYSATTTGGAGTTEGLYSDLAPLWGNSGTSTLHYKSVMGY